MYRGDALYRTYAPRPSDSTSPNKQNPPRKLRHSAWIRQGASFLSLALVFPAFVLASAESSPFVSPVA